MLQADPGRSYLTDKVAIDEAIQRVLQSGWYILGKEVKSFEEKFAQYIGGAYCLGVANGTDALELILRGLKIGAGDKVATVGNTAVATIAAIERAGAQVRFVDIEKEYYTMSPASLETLLQKESGIKAVIAVHLFGQAVDVEALQHVTSKYGVYLIEDCAQAHGTIYSGKKCGSMGIAAGFSFYPTKNLGAFGDGGAVVTSDAQLYERMCALRQYGWTQRYISEFSGVNSRLDEMQAAILSVKLGTLDVAVARRRSIAEAYRKGLALCRQVVCPAERLGSSHSYHQFVIQVEDRVGLMAFLKERQIGTAIHYPVAVPWQKAYQRVPHIVELNTTATVNEKILSLPMYPELNDEEVSCIIDAVLSFYN